MADSYLSRGVSSTKEDVLRAVAQEPSGLFPGAFCKIVEDFAGDANYCVAMHADGAGTKASLAYLCYKEGASIRVFSGIAQDSIVMNIDDLLCIGAVDNYIVSNTIARNSHRIEGSVISAIVHGYADFAERLRSNGIGVVMAGGETADLGDIVSTLVVDSTAFTRLSRNSVIDCSAIRRGDVIVGLSSYGRASYEDEWNSGIGSNGFTAARHLLLSGYYAPKYPETFSETIDPTNVYCGNFRIEDPLPGSDSTIGASLLSPTRTYAPIVRDILKSGPERVHGMIHCTGGGQVKCKLFGKGLHYIKDNLFETPAIFQAISGSGRISEREMFQVFNMGHRMEVYCSPTDASKIVEISNGYDVAAKVIGYVDRNQDDDSNAVTVVHHGLTFEYQ